ncbi:MAG TPA: indole-3-glycerol phosphate synthase TrpC [Actinomycetota bacterium]|nr:indole-3-glycerol phosphate synthase TrpC [Actinomycetota bacterium]
MTYLTRLLDSTEARVERLRSDVGRVDLEHRAVLARPVRSLPDALRTGAVEIIGEIKRASPSRGPLAPGADAGRLASEYVRGGAAALSVLTEPEAFDGRIEDIEAAGGAGVPVLRKDFILDDLQVAEARAAGADSVLLIVRIVDDDALRRLIEACRAFGMEPLVEVFDERDAGRAAEQGALLIGINTRDLESFDVDPGRTERLLPLLPRESTVVALSGVAARADVERLGSLGVHAVLVGESLVTSKDPAAAVRALLGRS